MDQLAGRDVALETVEEANELLVPVALHALPDHRAVEHVHGSEQRRRAVADVVVRHRAGPPLLHRQAGLRAVESLDLRLLVDREDDSMGRRVDVKADHIADLAGELRVAAELEGSQPVRRGGKSFGSMRHWHPLSRYFNSSWRLASRND